MAKSSFRLGTKSIIFLSMIMTACGGKTGTTVTASAPSAPAPPASGVQAPRASDTPPVNDPAPLVFERVVDPNLGPNVWRLRTHAHAPVWGDVVRERNGEVWEMAWEEAFDYCLELNRHLNLSTGDIAQIRGAVVAGLHPTRGYYLPLREDWRAFREALGADPQAVDWPGPRGYVPSEQLGDLAEYFWSASLSNINRAEAYVFYGPNGYLHSYPASRNYFAVRCVRVGG